MTDLSNNFLINRRQKEKVALNNQYSSWVDIRSGVPDGSIFGSLLFLIYVHYLSHGLKGKCKLNTDDTSLYFVLHDFNTSASDINKNLDLISDSLMENKF